MTTKQIEAGKDEKAAPVVQRNILLPGYSDYNTIRALTTRMKGFSQFAALEEGQRWALAQFALSLGLNPFVGECHYIKPDYAGGPEGPYVGIAGRVRKSQEQLHREGGNGATMTMEYVALTEEERALYHIPAEAVAQRCELRDSVTSNDWVGRMARLQPLIETLVKANQNVDAVALLEKLVGKLPITIGIGYLTKAEAETVNAKKDGTAKSKNHYPVIEKAQKRALAAALKKRFHIELPGFDYADLPATVATVLDGELHLSGTGQWTVDVPEAAHGSVRSVSDEQAPAPGKPQPSTQEEERRAQWLADLLEMGGTVNCMNLQCGHTLEQHGIKGDCEVLNCPCRKFEDPFESQQQPVSAGKVAANKRALGRDGGGLD